MNILVIGQFYVEGFATHIAETLTGMGHKVTNFEARQTQKRKTFWESEYYSKLKKIVRDVYFQSPMFEKDLAKKLEATLRSIEFDLVIVCYDFLTPFQVQLIKKRSNAMVCLWFPDHIGNFGKAMFVNSDYDFYFFKDPFIVKTLISELGLQNVFYLPECCNPVYHRKVELSKSDMDKYGCEITTAGNLHSMRVFLFNHLTDYDIKIWGHKPPLWLQTGNMKKMIMNHYVENIEKSKAFSGAKIVVNNLYPSEVDGVNVRTFEIAATGSFQLINYRSGLKQLYDEGSEIISFTSINDLKDKIRFYISKKSLRDEIGEQARQRTMKEHTYEVRLSLLINTVFASEKGFPIINYHP